MTLSFSTKHKGKPTNFVEKIWTAFDRTNLPEEVWEEYFIKAILKGALNPNLIGKVGHKLHTIRQDPKNRWKPGTPIHFVIKNRTANRFQFAPVLPTISVQKIKIYWWAGHPSIKIDDSLFFSSLSGFDNGMQSLAILDGFETTHDFFGFFNRDFEGKIIHWTDTRY